MPYTDQITEIAHYTFVQKSPALSTQVEVCKSNQLIFIQFKLHILKFYRVSFLTFLKILPILKFTKLRVYGCQNF